MTGPISQILLGGFSVGRQITDNFRNTGYFNDSTTAFIAPVSNPTVAVPVTFRQSATDADNHSTATSLSFYGQSQVVLSEQWQAIVGARYEHFDVDFYNHRTNDALSRTDDLISPRAALLFKPVESVTLYSSYSVSALPSSGDQFSSMTVTSATLEPEKFRNYEIGAKWDVFDRLSLSSAVYRLDRTNTTAPDPVDPTRTVQTGSQRTRGFEFSLTGAVSPSGRSLAGTPIRMPRSPAGLRPLRKEPGFPWCPGTPYRCGIGTRPPRLWDSGSAWSTRTTCTPPSTTR